MSQETFHPNAYLSRIRNFRSGLRSRSRILDVLEKRSADIAAVATEAGLHYGVVAHHLKLLSNEEIVQRKGGRPALWGLTGLGQKRLMTQR